MRSFLTLSLATCLLATVTLAPAADWPQWNGPARVGASPEKGLLKEWPKEGPKLEWTYKNAGTGYSAPAVVGGVLYGMGCKGEEETLFALSYKGGKPEQLWEAKIGPVYDFKANSWSRGPNGTPSVDGALVFALGSQGELVCVDAAKGGVAWRINIPTKMKGEVNPVGGGPEKFGWGYTWSPLVDGDHLIITPGGPDGLFAALDKKTGDVVWRSAELKDPATYSSPVVAEIGGVRQYIALVQNGVVGVAAKDGKLLWAYRRESEFPDVVCPTPIVQGSKVYITAWGGGAELLELTPDGAKFKATSVYAEKLIANRVGGVVPAGGYIYGCHEEDAWVCQDFATGAIKWKSPKRKGSLGVGSAAYADGALYCLAEDKGEVARVAADPAGFKVTGRFTLPEASTFRDSKPRGKLWTHPVVADGRLFLRDEELLFCYKIAAE